MLRSKKIDWKQRGQEAAVQVRKASSELSLYILKHEKKKPKEDLIGPNLLTFTSALYYLVVDREAFALLSEKDRADFSNEILNSMAIGLSELWNKPSEIMLTVIKVLNDNIAKLSPFAAQLVPDKDENPKGTLYWEFMKILSEEYDVETTTAIRSNTEAYLIGEALWISVKHLLPDRPKK